MSDLKCSRDKFWLKFLTDTEISSEWSDKHMLTKPEFKYQSQDDSIEINFQNLPILRPKVLDTKNKNFWQRLLSAGSRRDFYLAENWQITIEFKKAQPEELGSIVNGTILIPIEYENVPSIFDGASIPLPWLVSFLSFGVLRPIGVMLTASLVHDFAFQWGGLLYLKENEPNETEFRLIERHLADLLFKHTIAVVNQMPVTAFVGWLAVRLGWFGVKYGSQLKGGGTVREGKFPLLPFIIFLLIVVISGLTIKLLGFTTVVTILTIFYLIIFALLNLVDLD